MKTHRVSMNSKGQRVLTVGKEVIDDDFIDIIMREEPDVIKAAGNLTIKPALPRTGQVITNEMVQKAREKLGC